MNFVEAISPFESYSVWLIVLSIAVLAITTLPRFFSNHPFSLPIAILALGFLVVKLPLGIEPINPIHEGKLTEHLTEMGVILSLMGAGLKIDRIVGWKSWQVTWRLLGITMLLSILAVLLVGWWLAALAPVTALLLAAVVAPTDPVLASDIQVGSPGAGNTAVHEGETENAESEHEDDVRFALTSEAGLNDAMAFPFVNLAIALALAGIGSQPWWHSWVAIDVFYKLAVGGVTGWAVGKLLAKLLLSMTASTPMAKSMLGLGALAATLFLYGLTELVGGYGFLAVFIGALTIRNYERDHEYHTYMHAFAEKAEQLLMAIILLGLGAAIAGGLLAPITWPMVITAVIIVFLIRPLAGMVGLIGVKQLPWRERWAISFFGIRGIGSLYYLAYALNQHYFPNAEALWAIVALVIVISIVVHGITATPAMAWLDRQRKGK